jgi:hypothetical protein
VAAWPRRSPDERERHQLQYVIDDPIERGDATIAPI